MPSIEDMMANVTLRLGDPRANRPGLAQVLNQVCTQTRTVLRHKRNTSNPWNFSDVVIEVVPNEPLYQITKADFGTPLAVITYAPQLPTWIPRLIPFYGPQNMPYDWGFPQNMASAFIPYDGSNCTAQRCAIYWKNNVPYIEFLPVPQLVASYKIKYLQNANGTYDAALTTSPAWAEDCDLIEVRSALALLPITEWASPDNKEGRSYNAERRSDLASTMQAEEAELRRQFEAAALITTGPRINNRWSGSVVG